jgi:hypothetical protein
MKRSWKATLCGILVLALATAMTGCGSSDAETTTETDADSDSVAETTVADDSIDSDAADESSDAEESDADEDSDTDADADSDTDSSTAAADVTYGDYDIEKTDEVDQACADVIKAYFTAIEEQNFEDYKATLYDYYYNVYNDWLEDNYEYGMETTMEQMHEMLLDSAGGDNVVITGISVEPATLEDTTDEDTDSETADSEADADADADSDAEAETEEETEDLPTQYLNLYESLLGDGFTDEVLGDVDSALVISFTMKGTVDGGEETTIMEGYDLMMVLKDGNYYILG